MKLMDPDQKFNLFLDQWAAAQGCTFVIQGYDGRESIELIDGMAVDDVWGWLLPKGVTQRTDEHFGCVVWNLSNGRLELTWNTYEI